MSSSPLPAIAHGPLIAYAAADLLQFAMPGFTAAAIVSASGMVAALLVTITVYYLKQVATSSSHRDCARENTTLAAGWGAQIRSANSDVTVRGHVLR